MSRPLTHRPFAELEPPKPEVTVIRRRTTDPESGLSLVRQIRATPLPTDPPPNARLTPDPSEPEPVAKKKTGPAKGHKRSPESIAKQKATLAKKKTGRPRDAEGKAAFIRANPDLPGRELVKLAKKQGMKLKLGYVWSIRSIVKRENGQTKRAPKRQRNGIDAASPTTTSSQGIEALLESMVRRIVASELKRVLSRGVE